MDTSPSAVENRLAAFRRHCRERGLALTPQRLAIYQALAGDDSHPSAEEVFRRVKPTVLSLSLGTVYRTLELFEAHGLVSRVQASGNQARFDANQDPHSHLVCVRCHQVIDVPDPRPPRRPAQQRLPEGFRILAPRVQFLGICQDCQAQG
jgi:Fur family peroxide stress response transcriptional regulator